MNDRENDRRELEEERRRGDYLVSGHTPETQIALLTRDVEILIDRVRRLEEKIESVENLPQVADLVAIVEAYKRQQWLVKRIGMFLLAGPAMVAIWQAMTRLIEWIRGH